ncbi:cytochrome c oxidase subunit 3 family protein [Corallococcus sp. H22C18031201]|uniref:cytochrome c oxidase subunit 3 n=1 Tax=Citreicoccus inhibens TaxID=2849499 RepID=UPI000E7595D3|nr:cytochrome c oxidase subunit 3 [Citreicoccus inhibens]MBU8897293.1 cytochrome c oxidase subunit 3 [Citreicoccus inhibens]RJS21147.1 cytochrome c oxidase subunit 3 family protein [Corallococcus sp. H22C18031201]
MPHESTAEHWGSEAARAHAAHLGMWLFISTEVLLFAALFTTYGVYRSVYPEVWREAQAHMDVTLGTVNTVVLVTSSVLVALAVHATREGRPGTGGALLGLAALLGVTFLVLKGVEYAGHAREGGLPGEWYRLEALPKPGASLFFSLYYLLTGLHAVHVTLGVGVLTVLAVRAAAGGFSASDHTPLELGGMYWHLVDVIWLFVYPILYLS